MRSNIQKKRISIIFKIINILISPLYFSRISINNIRSYFGKNFGDTHIIFVAGYPKSGATWIENFISNIPGYSPRNLSGSKEIIRFHNLPKEAFNDFPKYSFSSVKTHVSPDSKNIEILLNKGIKKILIVYRDPRDIAISQYHHIYKNNPWRRTDPFYADY